MDVQAALLAAIADRPDDDTPRLVYADWLDDHAGDLPDPAAARVRAEFIRVQCEATRLAHLPTALLQGYAELYRRQDALLTYHRRDLIGPLSDDIGPLDAVFDRGFVSELRLDAPTFVANARAVATLSPRPLVTVVGAARYLDALAAVGSGLATVTAVEMQSERWPENQSLTAGQLTLAFGGHPWDRLRRLDLEGARVGDEGVVVVAVCFGHRKLTHLDVSGNDISDNGVLLLTRTPLWSRLRSLVLGGNPISDEGAVALADAPPTAIEYLNLKYTGLTRHGQQRVLRRKGWKVDLF